jgi:hypothetical protein
MQPDRNQAVENTESALGSLEEALVNRCTFPDADYIDAHAWWESVDYALDHQDGSPASIEMRDLVVRLRALLRKFEEEGEAVAVGEGRLRP